MSEFFKQLLAQLVAIWQRLSLQQKIITTALVAFTLFGMIALLSWGRGTPAVSGYKTLYSDLDMQEAGQITQKLDEGKYKYKIDNDGRTILVEGKKVYEVRMALARSGLPKTHGVGYELFDKTNLAMTDFVQKINAQRALEGELQRTIEGLEEVKNARVHIVVPEPSIFLEKQQDPKASVVVKMVPGRELAKDQVRGIMFLISSSVQGLKPDNISIIDYSGRLLSSPFGADQTAMASSRNLELQQQVEKYIENKTDQILTGVLGPEKAKAKASVDLDFDQIERTLEKFDPESKVVRSEERSDENVKNAPDGDAQKERSVTNYEIDKTVEHLVREVGNIKRMTISVAVDGKYTKGKDGKETYSARAPEELQSIEDLVKSAAGYDVARGDQIVVTNLQFDNEFLREQQDAMRRQEQMELYFTIGKYVLVAFIAFFFILFLRYLARTVADAMNPPVPKVEILGVPEDVPREIPEEMKKSSEILERVEMLTRESPVNIASIIRQWLREPGVVQAKAKGK